MTNASKITLNQDKNNGQQNQPIILEEPVLDSCVDGREFFLASNGSETEASESVTIEDPSGTDENNNTFCNKIDSMISKESVVALKNNRMLSDDVINSLQNMLNREYPDVKGLQDPVLGQTLQFKKINQSPFVQILHTGGLHLVAISIFDCNNGEVSIMDSLFHGRLSQHTKRQICSLMNCKKAKIVVNALPLQQQNHSVDCGPFAIAFVQFAMHYRFLCCKRNLFELEIYCHCRMIYFPCDKQIYGK